MAIKFNPLTGQFDLTGSAGGGSNAFTVFQPDAGTSPVPDSSTDTIILTSADGSMLITGDSTTDTLDFSAADISRFVVEKSDFIHGNTNMNVTVSGTGAISKINGAASTYLHPGVWKLQTGTTTTGKASIYGSDQDQIFALGGGLTTFETIVQLSNLSDGTDTFKVVVGLTDDPFSASVAPTHGVYWSYTHSVNSGNWTLNSTKAGVTTSVDSGIAGSATLWPRLAWVMNSAGTSIQGYINGVAVGSAITTNIPLNTTKLMLGWNIVKSAGTNNRSLHIDAYCFKILLSTAR